jgi:hypothetical protein
MGAVVPNETKPMEKVSRGAGCEGQRAMEDE